MTGQVVSLQSARKLCESCRVGIHVACSDEGDGRCECPCSDEFSPEPVGDIPLLGSATEAGTCGWGIGEGFECGLPAGHPGDTHWMVPTGAA